MQTIIFWTWLIAFACCSDTKANESVSLPSCCDAEKCETIPETKVFTAEGLSTFSAKLFDTSDFPARWYCGNWHTDVGWLHILSDFGIFAAYFTIPGVLLFFMLRKKDLPFPNVIWLFATFILACGFGHLVEAGIFWWPVYRFSGLVKGFTAIISWVTVFMLIRLMPVALQLPSAALLTKKLIKSQERLDIALKAAEVGVWELDCSNGDVSCDARTREIFDIREPSNNANQFFDRMHPDDREQVRDAVQSAIANQTSFSAKFRVVRADGTVCYVQSQGKLDFGIIESEQVKVPEKLIGVSFDITAKQLRDNALEKMVEDRTAALQLVLDSTGDGLVSINLDGILLPEKSRTISNWFGPMQPGTTVWDYLASDTATKESLEMAIEQIADDVLPFDVAVDQAPKTITRNGKTYDLEYRAIREQDKLARILVLVRDVTAELAAKHAESEMRELHTLVGNLLKDRDGFDRTLEECSELISSMHQPSRKVIAKHNLHTLKGNCATIGFQSVADHAHQLESTLVEENRDPTKEEIVDLDRCWQASISKIGKYLKTRRECYFEISPWELAEMKKLIERHASYNLLDQMVDSWQNEPTKVPLSSLAEKAERIAAKLGKSVNIVINDNHLRVPETRLRRFWSAMIHVIANAIDHGIESPEQRLQLGKPSPAKLELVTRRVDGKLEIEVSDDGSGIDWELVRKVARERGLPSQNDVDLIAAIFEGGVSTREFATEVSGRGVGLSAVRRECEDAGGHVHVESQTGKGTRFLFQFPESLDTPNEHKAIILDTNSANGSSPIVAQPNSAN